ncbi:unnamed protein product [Durusdinium trenchii]
MSRCSAAFFVPSDIHQRSFIELYRMQVPTFMPAVEWLLRWPLSAPFGAFSYPGELPDEAKWASRRVPNLGPRASTCRPKARGPCSIGISCRTMPTSHMWVNAGRFPMCSTRFPAPTCQKWLSRCEATTRSSPVA